MKIMMSIRRIKNTFTSGAVIALSSILLIATGCGHSSGSQQSTAVTVAITSPSSSPTTVAIGKSLALVAVATDGSGGSVETDPAGVTWSLTCTVGGTAGTGSACGTLTGTTTTAATYNAPSAPAGAVVVTVTATSVTDTAATAFVTINVPAAVVVTLTPAGSSTVADGGKLSISASTTNDPANAGVTWSLTCTIGGTAGTGSACGTLTGTTTTAATYNAPSAPAGAVVVTVTATSVSDTAATTSVTINVPAVIAITLTPKGSTTVADGGTLSISASTTNDPANAGVTWSLTCTIGGTAGTGSACGTLASQTTTSVVYNAPSTPSGAVVITVTATSVSTPGITATQIINVPAAIAITLTPAGSTTVADGGKLSISASTANDPANAGVTWSLTCTIGGTAGTGSACGTLTGTTTTAATYNAPSSPTGAVVVTVTATSVSVPSITATQIINVPAVIAITLTPAGSTTVADGGKLNISASTANDPANAGVTWSLTCTIGGTAGTGSACGTLTGTTTTAATYNAPATPTGAVVVTVTATSVSTPSITATQTLNVPAAVVITLTPAGSTTVADGGKLNISASTANDPANAGVTWSLTCTIGGTAGTGSACGTLTGTTTTAATYNAPSAPTGAVVVTVTATSVSAPSVTATQTLNVPAAIAITLTPKGSTTVADGGTLSISASTANDPANAGVTWSLSCTIGGTAGTGSTCGTLTSQTTTSVVYNAPSTPAGALAVTVTATSVSAPSITATQAVSVPATVAITLTPAGSTTVSDGGTLNISASTTNDPTNAGVTWSLTCTIGGTASTGAACGTLTATTTTAATYNAPSTPAGAVVVTVTATSIYATSITSTQTLNVPAAPSIAITPPTNTTVNVNTSLTVSAVVTNDVSNKGIAWSMTCTINGTATTGSACGTISGQTNTVAGATTTDSSVTYTAPATVTNSIAIILTATSNANSLVTATQDLSVLAAPIVTINSPAANTSVTGGATQAVAATVTNDSSGKGVTWTLTCDTGNGSVTTGSACGTVTSPVNTAVTSTTTTSTFIYKAPATATDPVAVTVTATSNLLSTSTATLHLIVPGSDALTIGVSPSTATVADGATQSLTGTVTNDSTNSGVTWSLSCVSNGVASTGAACGSLSVTSNPTAPFATVYTAPSYPSYAVTVTVTAASNVSDFTSASATLSVPAAPAPTIAVTPQPITPNTTYYMLSGGTLNLTAVVSNDQATPGVVWTVAAASGYTCPVSGCGTFSTPSNATSTPAAGQTTTTDTYTAPSGLTSPLEVILTATSNSETSVTATLNVTAQIAISFSPNILGYSYAGTSTPFSQTVTVTGGAPPYTSLTVDSSTLPSWVTATPNLTAGTVTFTGTPPATTTPFTALSPATGGSWANPTTLGTGTSMVSISATDSTPNQPLTATTSAPLTTYNPDEGTGTVAPTNAMMTGTYAFYGTGFENQPGASPAAASTAGYPQRIGVVGSLTADGNGNITGEIDVNDYNGYSFYNITGSYNVQPNQLATITLLLPTTPVTPVTLVAALGGLNGTTNIASTGQFIEYDDLAGVSGNRVAGEMSLVTSSVLSQSSSPLAGPFAFGMQGATPGSAYSSVCEAAGTCGPVAGAGQVTFTSGAVTGTEDIAYGALSASEVSLSGSLNSSGATDGFGRMTGSIAVAAGSGLTSWPTDYAIYSVSPSLFYFMSIDPFTTTSMMAGKAMQQNTTDIASTPLNGPLVLFGNAFAQQAILAPAAENGGMAAIFGLTATPSTSNPATAGTLASTITGTAGALNGYTTGSTVKLNTFTAISGIDYSVTTSSGRVALTAGTFTGGTNYLGLPVLYLVDTNLGFAVTTPAVGTNAYPTGMLVFYPQTGVASGLSAGNYTMALYKPDTPDSFAENGIFTVSSAVGTANEDYTSQVFISYTNESKSSNAGGDSLFDTVELSGTDTTNTIKATAAGYVSLQSGSSGVQGCNNGPGFIISSTSFVCIPSGTGTAASQEPLYAVQ